MYPATASSSSRDPVTAAAGVVPPMPNPGYARFGPVIEVGDNAGVEPNDLHAAELCKPCIFHHKGVCSRADCEYCHLPHDSSRIRQVRLSKTTKRALRGRVNDRPGSAYDSHGRQ